MFIPEIYHKSESEPWELQPATPGLELHVGTALVWDGSGELTVATGEVRPDFISMQEVTVKDGEKVHVERVRSETVYETALASDTEGLIIGEKYAIDDSGELLDGNNTAGAAELVHFTGAAAGSKVRVRFVTVTA